MKPTFEQMEHFFRLVKDGRVTRSNFQGYLENFGKYLVGLQTTYDQGLGLRALIERAVGSSNLGNINHNITEERFPLRGTGTIVGNMRVEPCLPDEIYEQAAERLSAVGHILSDTGDLAGFLHDHHDEVAKWVRVVALAKSACWTGPGGGVDVPFACVDGAYRGFFLGGFRSRFNSGSGVLVRCE